jgi:ABC-type Zn uptake system ZnuABC Zn-binding protein ZnuA
MKTTTVTILTLMLLAAASLSAQDTLQIVSPHPTLCSMAGEIGGEHVETICLSSGMRDPHFVAAKPSYMSKTRRADLWIRYGMDMEIGYERLILEGSRNRDIQVGNTGHLDMSENVLKLEIPHGPVNRSMGDVHPLGNPHYWLDPYNGRIMARTLADRLAELMPANAEYFIDRGEEFVRRIDAAMFGEAAVSAAGGEELWQALLENRLKDYADSEGISPGGWYVRMKPHHGKAIVTYHKTLPYFANRFGLEIPIELEPKPGIPPGPRHVLAVVKTIEKENVSVIAVAPYYDNAPAENAAAKTGASVVEVPTSVGGAEAADDYISLIDTLVSRLAGNLQE